jgi:hypothetical protein
LGARRRRHYRDVIVDLDNLERLSRAELQTVWTEGLAEKPPPSLGRDILALGIAYARQELRYGGLSRPVAKELDRLLARALGDGNDRPELQPNHCREPAPSWCASGSEQPTTSG